MFRGFSEKTADFLWGLALNNDRGWFNAHREEYEEHLNQPFRALAAETFERMQTLRSDVDLRLHIARIYRDARRLYGRGPFKENLWFTIHQGDPHEGGPTFWFELNGREWSYCAGWWEGRADLSAAWRAAIDADPARFEAIIDAIAARGPFQLWGETFKRPRADRGEKLNPWYNRKNLSVGWEHVFGGAMFSEDLPAVLADGYALLIPFFDFTLEVFQKVQAERAALRALSLSGEREP